MLLRGTSYTDESGTTGKMYAYAVAARNTVGTSEKSAWSSPKQFPGTAADQTIPANVTAAAVSSTGITVNWGAVAKAQGYKVYRSSSESDEFALVSGNPLINTLSHSDTGLTPATAYYYKIAAVIAGQEGEKSLVASATTDPSNEPVIDWASYDTGYVFRARNNTDQRLIAFKASLSKGNILGGIASNEQMHGFKKNADLFTNKSEDFPIIFITEDQYNANKNNLIALNSTPFTRIYGFYNATGTNETVYEINAGLGGEYSLGVQPAIKWNAELRLDGAHGPTLGYVQKAQYNTTFKLGEGVYNIFPVIRQYNPYQNEIISFYPKYEDGRAKLVMAGLDAQDPETAINLELLLNNTPLSTGSAFIIVDNQSQSGVQLFNGDTPLVTSTGSNFVNVGRTRLFQVNMAKLSGNKYAEKQSINTYKLGTVSLSSPIGNYELEVDNIYRVIITGSNEGWTISPPEFEAVMDLSDFGNSAVCPLL